MIRAVCAVLAFVALTSVDVAAADKQPKGKHKPGWQPTSERESTGVSVDVHFSSGDVRMIREHYAPRYRGLPPGLQKKLQRGGQLPPGWRKKMEPFPPVLEGRLTALPRDYQRGVIDGHAVIYRPRSQTIIDVTVLF
jgi:hypothetical protein